MQSLVLHSVESAILITLPRETHHGHSQTQQRQYGTHRKAVTATLFIVAASGGIWFLSHFFLGVLAPPNFPCFFAPVLLFCWIWKGSFWWPLSRTSLRWERVKQASVLPVSPNFSKVLYPLLGVVVLYALLGVMSTVWPHL